MIIMNPARPVDVPNREQRRIMTNHIPNLNEDSIPDSPAACLCSKPSAVKDPKFSYDHESDCLIASKGDVQVGRHMEEHRRMRRSLNLAKAVQQNLLPKNRPDYKGLDVAGKSIYCDETGGDCFDYHDLGEEAHEKLGVAIGDVSGHGISAVSIIRRNKYGGAKQILDAVFDGLKQFRRDAELEDDITLVVSKIED